MRPIAYSPADPARPPGADPGAAASVHATLQALVVRVLGSAHAAMLARPVPRPDGGIDWFTELPGDIAAPASLSPTDREALRRLAEPRLADLAALQRRLAAEGPASRATARLLAQALDLDLDTCLHGVGGQPVLAPWGAVRTAPTLDRPAAAEPAVPASPPSATTAPVSPGPNRVHAVASVLLLVTGCGAFSAALQHRQAVEPAAATRLQALASRNAALAAGIDRARAGDCRPGR